MPVHQEERSSAAASFFGVTLRKTTSSSPSSSVISKSQEASIVNESNKSQEAFSLVNESIPCVIKSEPENIEMDSEPKSPTVIAPLPELSPVAPKSIECLEDLPPAVETFEAKTSQNDISRILLSIVHDAINCKDMSKLQSIYEMVEDMKKKYTKEDINFIMATLTLFPLLSALLGSQNEMSITLFEEVRKAAFEEISFYGNRLCGHPSSSSTSTSSFISSLKDSISSLKFSPTESSIEKISKEPSTKITLEGNRYYLRKEETSSKEIHSLKAESIGQALSIEDCKGSSVSIDSKLTSVVMDHSIRSTLYIKAPLVSGLELLGCRNCTLHLYDVVPTIVLDDCEAIQIFLYGEDCFSVRILSSKCTEINVLIPNESASDDGDDWKEMSIPTQFTTALNGKILITEPVKHVGV